ncbi:patatin-like phospholipase family protein [Aquincola sp. MAHUQ-54]|uniref:Patatin-like phospholipase family protein n=1 Tax=Aquincola agrisoli TaxID=3119538 RepID=A0AAW9QFW8_9BURK
MTKPVTGLVLTGGGARAAYQVGVLKAISRIRREAGIRGGNPFPIITGTSAGAINAAALACYADHFDLAVQGLAGIWQDFHAEQVYRADAFGVIRTGARWLTMLTAGWALARWRRARPRSLLDNAPLSELLQRMLHLDRLKDVLRGGHLRAVAVTASSYTSGNHVTFYDAVDGLSPWTRSQRLAVRDDIRVEHLLASSAIPFVFPAAQLSMRDGHGHTWPEWFGDGSMRQTAPMSPAVHLGAERVVVIGAGRMQEPELRRSVDTAYPTLAQVAGHALSNIFLDALAVDVERLQRINRTLALLPAEARVAASLRPIDVLLIAPSQRLDDLAARHLGSLPVPVRSLLRGVGVGGQGPAAHGAALASYLLFESPYTRELMALGEADTQARRGEVERFFGWVRRDGGLPHRADTLPAPAVPQAVGGD